jgi:hypothetical protein
MNRQPWLLSLAIGALSLLPACRAFAVEPLRTNETGAAEVIMVKGWTVHVRRQLREQDEPAVTRALGLLKAQLEEICRVVPPVAVVELRKVHLWMSPEYPHSTPCAAYHPNVNWLRTHSRDPAMAKSVEFTNVRIFDAECRRMPIFVLHELAHAYHDQVLGYDCSGIKTAYAHAKAAGKYDRVQRQDSEGRLSYDRAYALTNDQEYFAETTEAFFGRNDMEPFTRAELETFDPEMFALLKKVWKCVP